ncbi:ribosomal protein S18-alanine N-acetyltransferase [Acinetobacter larvae]|uniref:[Ribosomal protein bS18]-alanine N-acetyltransferase n=1 Tax=Acinetobacter larvae TaxID=1789224 RepID=A0A1B2M1M5_9GAMM|nr:ribosomal protein S18-alanine N-acetyltransferase [Acinetobacter larvae]AOA59095.1 ribosomal-protein-alanine N-acetyltransferase [Acinetobacter larvae]
MFRAMLAEDLNAVHQIEQQVQTHPWSLKQFQQSLESDQCTVLLQQQRVIGFCILQTVLDEANLLLMAIDPAFQGQGYGQQLLTQALDALPNHPIQVFLEVRESNQAAIHFYQKLDFHQIDLRKNYYPLAQGGREHAIIMVKSCCDDFHQLFKP